MIGSMSNLFYLMQKYFLKLIQKKSVKLFTPAVLLFIIQLEKIISLLTQIIKVYIPQLKLLLKI